MGEYLQELFHFGLYKRSQGRVARQVTFAAVAAIVVLGAWSMSGYYSGRGPMAQYGIPLATMAAGLWAGFRLVHMPTFADFLISVEAEMNKVSWPTRGELFRASIVVMMVIFFMAAILFAYDTVWKLLLGRLLG